jgi:hypothetical protein
VDRHGAHVDELHHRILATLRAMGDGAPEDLAALRYWLPRVARYSFRHRKLAGRPAPRRQPE